MHAGGRENGAHAHVLDTGGRAGPLDAELLSDAAAAEATEQHTARGAGIPPIGRLGVLLWHCALDACQDALLLFVSVQEAESRPTEWRRVLPECMR